MSWLSKAFGAPKASSGGGGGGGISQSQAALQGLNDRIEIMDKKLEHLEKLGREEQKKAKAYGTRTAENKRKAMHCLKKYKQYMQQCKQIEGQRDNLDAQKSALDMSILAAGNVQAMQSASNTIASNMNIDEVEDTVDKIQDQLDQVNEVVDAMSRPMAGAIGADEDELEDELAEFLMDDEEVDGLANDLSDVDTNALPAAPTLDPLPGVPTAAPQKTTEQAQLDEISAWMN